MNEPQSGPGRTRASSGGAVRRSSPLLLVATLVATAPAIATAQTAADRWQPPVWVGHVTFLGSNALIGGLTAGLMQELRGGDFSDGFARGALGGAVAYAGRRVAVEHFDGAGLLGRQVSAVGVSMVRNAGEGRRAFERLFFPIGPVHVHIDRSEDLRLRPKVSFRALGWAIVAAIQDETVFDWAGSLSAGAPVFWSPRRRILGDGRPINGIAAGGTIVLSDLSERRRRVTFAHERVHVLQGDFLFYAWSDPVEERLAQRTGLGRMLYRYIDFDIVVPSARSAFATVVDLDDDDHPQQLEANFLEDRGGGW